MIRFIAAIDDKRGLANDEEIPWHVSTDVKYFREKTMNGTIIMGHKTYGEFAWPLPGRRNMVVMSHKAPLRPGFEPIYDVEAFLKAAKPTDNIWIIGGGKLFESTMSFAEELYLTHVQGDFKCTKFFPPYEQDFELVSQSEPHSENGISFTFNVYRRKQKR